jgi:anti-anti-sigma regulatory factor
MQTEAGRSEAGRQPADPDAEADDPARSPAIHLDAISDTAAAPALHAALAGAMTAPTLGSGASVVIVASNVDRIATACVQVLLAAERSLARRGIRLIMSGVSDAMRAGLCDLGLADDLARWTGAHG